MVNLWKFSGNLNMIYQKLSGINQFPNQEQKGWSENSSATDFLYRILG